MSRPAGQGSGPHKQSRVVLVTGATSGIGFHTAWMHLPPPSSTRSAPGGEAMACARKFCARCIWARISAARLTVCTRLVMVMISSVVGLVCVADAASSGAGLVDSGVPGATMTMAMLIGAALACCAADLCVLGGRRSG